MFSGANYIDMTAHVDAEKFRLDGVTADHSSFIIGPPHPSSSSAFVSSSFSSSGDVNSPPREDYHQSLYEREQALHAANGRSLLGYSKPAVSLLHRLPVQQPV
jgi:hypothetical protein